jgi:glycosyltransferase involved in cell wall biosynthesis
MKIAIDLRSLHTGKISGVENYIINAVEHLLRIDKENTYALFYNGFQRKKFDELRFMNSTFIEKRIPNKLLNLSLKFLQWPKFEQFIGEFDTLFLPNFNYFALSKKTPLAVTVHDLSPVLFPEYYSLKRRLWHWFIHIERVSKRANALFAVSEFTKHDLVERFRIDPNKIRVIYPGINHQLFHHQLKIEELRAIRNKYDLPGDFMLFLNTIEPRKNILRIIEAFEMLDKPVTLIIGGKAGWKYGAIFERIRRSRRRRLIRYIGYIPEADKPAMIKLARLVVAPSLYEGFGFPALEGLAVGTLVLTSNITSLPEVVGDAALMVDPYSAVDIACGMRELLYNESLRTMLVERGLLRAKQFTWEKTAKQLLEGLASIKK